MKLRKIWLSKWQKTDSRGTGEWTESEPLVPGTAEPRYALTREELKSAICEFCQDQMDNEPSGDFWPIRVDAWLKQMEEKE